MKILALQVPTRNPSAYPCVCSLFMSLHVERSRCRCRCHSQCRCHWTATAGASADAAKQSWPRGNVLGFRGLCSGFCHCGVRHSAYGGLLACLSGKMLLVTRSLNNGKLRGRGAFVRWISSWCGLQLVLLFGKLRLIWRWFRGGFLSVGLYFRGWKRGEQFYVVFLLILLLI